MAELNINAKKYKDHLKTSKKLGFIEEVALAIFYRDGSQHVIRDENETGESMKLFDLILKTGIYKKDLVRIWYRNNILNDEQSKRLNEIELCNHMTQNTEIDDEITFGLCEYMAQNGFIIMIREKASKKQGVDYYKIRLYTPQRLEQIIDQLDIPISLMLYGLDLSELSKEEKELEHIGFTLIMGDTTILDNEKILSINNFKEEVLKKIKLNIKGYLDAAKVNNTIVVSGKGDIHVQKNSDYNSYEGLLSSLKHCMPELVEKIEPEQNSSRIYNKLSKNGAIVLSFLHNSFSFDTNQKVLFVPKGILGNDQQLMILKSILKEYEDMRKSNNNLPISLTIYVDGVFLKKLSKDSFKWNYKDLGENDGNGEDDYLADTVFEEIVNRLKRIDDQIR